MRRGFSLFLILLFSLGPLAATLQAGDDARLPTCCRRNGAHHCAMTATQTASLALAAGQHILIAPNTCPRFPGNAFTVTNTAHALAASPAGLPPLAVSLHSANGARAAARISQARTRSSRAPPSPFLS
jgi:hypothetical protein